MYYNFQFFAVHLVFLMFHEIIHLIFVCDLIHLSVCVFMQAYLDADLQVF